MFEDYTEADTCRLFILPKLQDSGWEQPPHSVTQEKYFTDGRIISYSNRKKRKPGKKADFLLRYTRDRTIAVVEAKKYALPAGNGLQQAKEYAEILDLKFAYATNGREIIEFDFLTGQEQSIDAFPSPNDLWQRLKAGQQLDDDTAEKLLTPFHFMRDKQARYYQEIAINRTVQAILQNRRRILLTMATGTGKTFVAFQICWQLWNMRWNQQGTHRRPRILYLADRNILVDDPKDKMFAAFGDARHKIQSGEVVKSREMYFAIYQAIAEDEYRPGLYREYSPDFFDLIIVDECHRGSARDDSNWREILEYFEPAYQLGMTATPLREDNRNTYEYFGSPLYQYSLKQGIDDGFLAPYRVHRVITTVDASGWRPSKGQLDRYGREVPDQEYTTSEFDRVLALRARTEAIARHLTDYLYQTDRFAKTIIFCVDQDHADEMRRQLNNLNTDLAQQNPNYVVRITSDEGNIGRGFLSKFQEPEIQIPSIVTTSKLLTTGVDIPTCQNIVIARVVNSMTEFKQIIGRGTRVRDDYDKLDFTILDYTGSATRLFADPEFDGFPANITEELINEAGETVEIVSEDDESLAEELEDETPDIDDVRLVTPNKYYVDDGAVEIVAHLVYDLDADGNQLRVVKFTDYTAEKVRTLYRNSAEIRAQWADPVQRAEVITLLEDRGISFEHLAEVTNQPDADPFDLLCHVAFNAPLRSRSERARRVRQEEATFFDQYGDEARAILDELLNKYTEFGTAQFSIPEILKVPPLSDYGNVIEIASYFGGADQMREAVNQLQTLLYAA